VRHDWPGNVRELESAAARLALVARGPVVGIRDLEQDPELYDALTRLEAPPVERLTRLERREIERALRETGGNRVRAARLLGISRATIFRKIKEYGL
jgi:DNA-binding NtrC family response regulator